MPDHADICSLVGVVRNELLGPGIRGEVCRILCGIRQKG